MKKIFLVVNPAAGNRSADIVKEAMDRHFAAAQVELYETTGDEDVAAVVKDGLRQGAEWVFAAGGDGTVSAVADGLVGTNVPLGIIPVGTSNALARTLGFDLEAVAMCAALAGEVTCKALDAIKYGDEKYCFLQAGMGLDSRMMASTSREAKNRFGVAAYLGNAVKEAVSHEMHHFTVTIDGVTQSLDASEVIILNANSLGVADLTWGDHISPRDGQLDLCILQLDGIGDYAQGIIELIQGADTSSERIRYLTATKRIKIESDPPLPVQGDGEMIGSTPFAAELIPSAIQVLHPVKSA